jgi:hypothetical protein
LHVFTSFLLRTIDLSLSHVNGFEPPIRGFGYIDTVAKLDRQ